MWFPVLTLTVTVYMNWPQFTRTPLKAEILLELKLISFGAAVYVRVCDQSCGSLRNDMLVKVAAVAKDNHER